MVQFVFHQIDGPKPQMARAFRNVCDTRAQKVHKQASGWQSAKGYFLGDQALEFKVSLS